MLSDCDLHVGHRLQDVCRTRTKAKALKDMLAWCLTDGQKMSEKLGYVPLPDKVVNNW